MQREALPASMSPHTHPLRGLSPVDCQPRPHAIIFIDVDERDFSITDLLPYAFGL